MGRSKTIPAIVDKGENKINDLKSELKSINEYHTETEFELTSMIEDRTTTLSKELLELAKTVGQQQALIFTQTASINMLTKNLEIMNREITGTEKRLELLTKFTIALFCCIIILTIKFLGGF